MLTLLCLCAIHTWSYCDRLSMTGATDIAASHKMTSYHSIKSDVINAGAKWQDKEVISDGGIVTSRNPGDLEAFSKAIIAEISNAKQSAAA